MWVRLSLLVVLAAAASAAADTPIAEVLCASRTEIEARLTRQYHATLVGTGMRDPEAMVEVWSDDAGRWTLVQRYASGRSCILAMGEYWTAPRPPA